jgi:hypothetical protein
MSARAGSPLSSGPVRFALEACFIVLVGVIAAVLDLSPLAIVVVMGLAWVTVALVERAAKSTATRPRRPREPVREEPVEAPPLEAYDDEPPPTEPSRPQARRLRSSETRPADEGGGPTREWNLWELERRARDHAGADAVPEEWAAIFMSLREFAKSDGRLPPQFDSLVRESFPELTRAG